MRTKSLPALTILFATLAFGSSAYPLESTVGNPYAQDWLEEFPEPVKVHVGTGRISDTKYSPDGKFLAVSTNQDYGLHVYSTETFEKVYQLGKEEGFDGWRIAFNPDSKTLVSGSMGGTIRLWDVVTGTLKRSITTHSYGLLGIAFSPDGKTIASCGVEGYFILDGQKLNIGTIHLWDANTGHLLHSLTEHERGVLGVSFSPDGKTLASNSFDNIIRLWDVATGTQKHKGTVHNRGIRGISFSPDGKTIASFGQWDGIQIWDASIGHLLHHLVRKISDTDGVYSIAFSPDGQTLASGSGAGVRLWDVSTGSYLRSFLKPRNALNIQSVAFSPDGRTLASGADYGTIYLWNIAPSQLPEDVNNDGVVNIQDLVVVANAFGESEPDLNDDGVVNIQDLVIVASAFGNTVSAIEE